MVRPAPPRSLREAAWRGAKTGLRWTTYVVGPLALLMLTIGVVLEGLLIALGQGLPRLADSKTRALLLGPFGFYIVSCLWGVVIGVILGSTRYLVGRLRARASERTTDKPLAEEFPIPTPGPNV